MVKTKKEPWLKSLLSSRDKDVLKLISLGFTDKEISTRLFLSHRTIEKYRQRLLMKSQSRNTAHLISNAYENGWL